VPWTCRWGSFGGPVTATHHTPSGFVFWVCTHEACGGPLQRETCEGCPHWEAMSPAPESDRGHQAHA
jgi:hypothetical protein